MKDLCFFNLPYFLIMVPVISKGELPGSTASASGGFTRDVDFDFRITWGLENDMKKVQGGKVGKGEEEGEECQKKKWLYLRAMPQGTITSLRHTITHMGSDDPQP